MGQEAQPAVSHIRVEPDDSVVERPLPDHLRCVAALAAAFAERFGAADWAHQAGIWHDLGKFSQAFQKYLRHNADPNAHIEDAPGRVNHSDAGAIHAIRQLGSAGYLLAYLIAGHHAGLADFETGDTGRRALKARLQHGEKQGHLEQALQAEIPAEILAATAPTSKPRREGLHLWLRMLFSCLVDADFLDTERFMQRDRSQARKDFPAIKALREALDCHMADVMTQAKPTPVNALRADVYRQCVDGASSAKNLFSLTVPTGGGKTLASLAFALRHAEVHGKRRVIYAIPYTSIIEQTAEVFGRALGEHADALVEHHSNAEAEPEKDNHKTRLACENWDAPLIVTTNVQLFESLFAARTSRCRKLHNVADSVIVLDEAQTLSPEFLQPMVTAMRLLSEHFGVSFVFCTATQPELGSRKGFDSLFEGLDGVHEIVDDVDGLYRQLKRVNVHLPPDLHAPTDWPALADELAALDRSVLCIVNTRKDCRELYKQVRGRVDHDVYHLSALMCGEHRSRSIAEIKRRLGAGDHVTVISTQLVEAGVDLDFPVVYRALAGLDAIAQAAGRCNREGKLPQGGDVHVFVPPAEPPPGLLRVAAHKTRQALYGHAGDPLTPALFQRYFTDLYTDTQTDAKGIQTLLTPDGLALNFRTAAELFRLIDDDHSGTVFVKYAESKSLIDQVQAAGGPERRLMRKLQRYAVNVPRRDLDRLHAESSVEEIFPGVFVQIDDTLYDEVTGLRTETSCSSTLLVSA